jgi:predicted phosphodiesterase
MWRKCANSEIEGAPGEIRTPDRRLRRPLLYPLSYGRRTSRLYQRVFGEPGPGRRRSLYLPDEHATHSTGRYRDLPPPEAGPNGYASSVTIWGFLSDIHGSLAALDRALGQCREHGVERYAFLGDFLGRGDPDGVIERVRELGDIVITGNRDIDWADRVSPSSCAYVSSLPRRIVADDFVVAHGDPKLDKPLNVNDLRRGAPKTFDEMRKLGKRLFFFGHTHHARTWTKDSREAPLELLESARVELPPRVSESVVIVNVGTTGLPFPGKGPASFVILDSNVGGYVEHVLVAGE